MKAEMVSADNDYIEQAIVDISTKAEIVSEMIRSMKEAVTITEQTLVGVQMQLEELFCILRGRI